jgi:REP element-mobilizing transposase RayT
MPQSLSNLLVHLVFSTKGRDPLIVDAERRDLHAYLAGTARGCKCECFRVGGTDDHVHMAIRLHQTQCMSKLVEAVKSSSSLWIKTASPDMRDFAWQRGYGALSVSAPDLDRLVGYIDRQADHHKRVSFQDEFRAILREHGMEFDERYVWD